MKKKLSKTDAKKKVNDFFLDVQNKSSKAIIKIKKLAMSYNIPLKEKRRLFCKKCLTPYTGKEKVRIKNKMKKITCINCDYTNKWDINSS